MSIQDEIVQIAYGYLSTSEIDRFLGEVRRWTNIEASFFQLTQKGDQAALEFGAHADRILIDITAKKGHIETWAAPLLAIDSIRIYETVDATELFITVGRDHLNYSTAAKEQRLALGRYGQHIQYVLSRGVR